MVREMHRLNASFVSGGGQNVSVRMAGIDLLTVCT